MKKETSNQYWTNEHEDLVKQLIVSTDQLERSQIYNQLRPAILKLIQGVYSKFVFIEDQQVENEAKANVEFHLIEKVISSFKSDRGTKAYSYLGNSIKNFFWDVRKEQKKQSILEPLYHFYSEDDEGELKLTVDKVDCIFR